MGTLDVSPFVFRNPVSAGTHLLWCLWAVFVTGLLWRLARGDRLRQLSVGCFGLSMVLLYAASGTYHAIPARFPQFVHFFQRVDHSAIYVMIAGTYTPVFAVLLQGRRRWWMLGLIWVIAAVGVACKWLLPWPPYGLTVGLYIGMGWVGIVTVYPLFRAVGVRGCALGLLGGILYMAGGVCDAARWPVVLPHVVGPHEVLHVLDMGATLIHVFFVLRYVVPFQG
jgi:hemolysin III